DPANVATRYAQLYEEGMQISLGTVTTAPGKEFKILSKDDSVFFITPSATADAIPEFANGYQMCFADSNQGAASAIYFNETFVGKTIGVFYKSDDDYSKGIYEKFMENLDDAMIPDESNIKSFTDSTATSFTQQVEDLSDCDVIFMPIYYGPASTFMKQAVGKIGVDTIYYGCDGFDGIDAIDGFDVNTIPQEISYLSHFNSNETSGPAKEFIDNYNAKYDEEKEPLNQFGASAYDCVYAIYEALKVAIENGEEITVTMAPSEFCDILTEVFDGDFTFRGITGKCENGEKSYISWDEVGMVEKEAVKYIVKEKTAE
ncbi:MAG: ABC transporter substrate-binding protein, partial [Clostridia bacterium]|nr:ABC transporter substrate-binding protein [Clostridia bacterium]